MIIELHPSFKKAYQKRIAINQKLVTKLRERLKLFQRDPTYPILKDHPLKGEKINLRAFSVMGNIRIVYLPISENHVILLDIGGHSQFY